MSTFVGRTRELRSLAALLAGGGPSAALVSGVAGSGKTRLLSEAVRARPGIRSFGVVGLESGQNVPLSAAAGLFRALVAVPRYGEALDELVFGGYGIVPEHARASRAMDQRAAWKRPPTGALEPLRIFEATCRCLQSVEPAVLVVDDLQWADELSLALCQYLVRAAHELEQGLVILAATRPGIRGEELFDGLPDDRVERLNIGPLSHEDGTALAMALDSRLTPEMATNVWRQANGLPFWVRALVQHGGTGERLQQVITVRLRGVGADAATLLGALALVERPMSVAAAAELLEQPAERIEAALQVLADRGLAERLEDGARPAHDLIRRRAAAELSVELRRRLHGQIATQLERNAGGDLGRLRQALEHRRAGGLSVIELGAGIARSPQRRLLGPEGLKELATLADEGQLVSSANLAFQADLAELASELGQHEQALARWSSVAEREESALGRAQALLGASRAAYALGRAGEARELLTASKELRADDDLLKLEQQAHDAAIYLWLEQRTAEGRALAREVASTARRLAGEGGEPPHASPRLRQALLAGLRLEYEAAMQEGDRGNLLRSAQARLAAARDMSTQEFVAAGLAVAVALRQNGKVHQAVASLRRALAEAERAVLPLLEVDAGFWLGRTLALIGDLNQAEQVATETNRVAARVGDVPRARHRVARVVAGVWFEQGKVASARSLMEREAQLERNDHQRMWFHGDPALWEARLLGPAAAKAVQVQLDAAYGCAAAAGCPRCEREMMLIAAEAFARIGDGQSARAALERSLSLGTSGDELEQLAQLHISALLSATAEGSAEALEAALAALAVSPYRLPVLWMQLDYGRALAVSGNDRAIGTLQAVVGAREWGASTVADLAERSLRELGVRTWRRRATGAPLTGREQEVATLVAQGATNREVAVALFLSPKTVERHLVNLFRKLDVRNRTELASRLSGHPKDAGNHR